MPAPSSKLLPVALLGILLAPSAAMAECPSIEELGKREARLAYRIDSATQSGIISPAESQRLKRRLDRIADDVDGCARRRCLSNLENNRFHQELTDLSVRISHDLRNKPAEVFSGQDRLVQTAGAFNQ